MAAEKPTLSIFSDPKGLGTVFREQNQLTVKFFEISTPFQGSDARLSTNVLGKQRIIILQGAQDGTGFDGVTDNLRLKDFVFEMDSLTFTYNVDAVDWSWARSIDDPNRILYTLIMKETASLT